MQEFLARFNEVKVLVIGDLMLDRYLWGTVDRISPEAPVPVVSLNNESCTSGGAGNVAANIVSMGATALLVGVVGDDPAQGDLRGCLDSQGITDGHLVVTEKRKTAEKTRVIAHEQQVVRIDSETVGDIDDSLETKILDNIRELIEQADIVLISDYAKGVVTADVVSETIRRAHDKGLKVLIDPKGRDYDKYRNADLLTPNQREALDAAGTDGEDESAVRLAGQSLVAKHHLENLIVTRGEKGMTLFSDGAEPKNLKTQARRVFDVTGAGDTVIAAMAVAMAAGAGFEEAAQIANMAAGLVVETVGTTPVSMESLSRQFPQSHKKSP